MANPLASSPTSYGKFGDIPIEKFVEDINTRTNSFGKLPEDQQKNQMKWIAGYVQQFLSGREQEFEKHSAPFEDAMGKLIRLLQKYKVIKNKDIAAYICKIQEVAKCTFQHIPHSVKPVTLKAIAGKDVLEAVVPKEQLDLIKSDIFTKSLTGPFKEAASSEIVLGGISNSENFHAVVASILGLENVKDHFDINNMVELIQFASLHNLTSLQAKIKEFLAEKMKECLDSDNIETAEEIYNEIISPLKGRIYEKSDSATYLKQLENEYLRQKAKKETELFEKSNEPVTYDNYEKAVSVLNSLYEKGQSSPKLLDRFFGFIRTEIETGQAGPDLIQTIQSYDGPAPQGLRPMLQEFANQMKAFVEPTGDFQFEWMTSDPTALFVTPELQDQEIARRNLQKLLAAKAFDWFKVISCRTDYVGKKTPLDYEDLLIYSLQKIFEQLSNATCQLPRCLKITCTGGRQDEETLRSFKNKVLETKEKYPKLANMKILVTPQRC